MEFNFSRKCKKHNLFNCPNPQCNSNNRANQIMEKVTRVVDNLKLAKVRHKNKTNTDNE